MVCRVLRVRRVLDILIVLSIDIGHLVDFFDFQPLKTQKLKKKDWRKIYLFLVTDHSA